MRTLSSQTENDPIPSPSKNVKTDKASYARSAIPTIYCDVHNSYSKFDDIFRDHFLCTVYLLLYWRTVTNEQPMEHYIFRQFRHHHYFTSVEFDRCLCLGGFLYRTGS